MNTPELKAKFFAQYWGQHCVCNDEHEYAWRANITLDAAISIYSGDLSEWYAKLKPLSAITDEDAIEVAKILHPGNDQITILSRHGVRILINIDSSHSTEYGLHEILDFSQLDKLQTQSFIDTEYWKTSCDRNKLFVFDFLRSCGYALPFMGISVEQMVEWGWIKLIEKEEVR